MRCAVCGVRCAAFEFMQCAAERMAVSASAAVCGSVRGSVRLSGSARGSVRLSCSAAVCGSPAVCIFSNKFNIRVNSYKSGINQII